jgi:hypothetical protein
MDFLSRRIFLTSAISGVLAAYVLGSRLQADELIPLAIKGYDPVAYFTLGQATPGSPDIEFQWDEHRYRFSSAKHRELFKAAPARYAPQFTNHCSMAIALGLLIEADPESWLISDGKLYVFGGPKGRELFQQDLSGNIAKANENRNRILGR